MIEGFLICAFLYTVAAVVLGGAFTAGILALHVAVVPLVFRYSKTFRRSLIFANFVQWPLRVNFEEPSESGIEGGRNLSIEYQSVVDDCPIKIGIWHILPKTSYERLAEELKSADRERRNKLLHDDLATTSNPVMLYCHGNSNSRAASHRIELYKFFQNMDFHTIAFDYRGYGDSSSAPPSEPGVVEDARRVYEWLLGAAGDAPVFVWGHSLGTGIACHLLGELGELRAPRGLVLEAPFNNLADEVAHHPLAKLVSWLPYFERAFVSQFESRAEHSFRSDEHLARARALPALVLHARDDLVVPHRVGVKLYEHVVASRGAGDAPVALHSYEASERLGHKWICRARDLPAVVGAFVAAHRSGNPKTM